MGIIIMSGKVLERLRTYSLSRNSFARQVAAPQLILKWEKLTSHWKERAVIAFLVTEGEKPTCIQKVFSVSMVKLLWMPVLFDKRHYFLTVPCILSSIFSNA
jgi:hypothetical protein